MNQIHLKEKTSNNYTPEKVIKRVIRNVFSSPQRTERTKLETGINTHILTFKNKKLIFVVLSVKHERCLVKI